MMKRVNRREFLKGGLASLGFMALDGLPVYAAPLDWKPNRKPDLVFGILTDTHLMTAWDAKSVYRTMSLGTKGKAIGKAVRV